MSEVTHTPRKVMIVEDDMLLSMVEEKLIERLGHEVVGKVGTGKDAIEAYQELQPDLILMDIILKGDMDGIQVMEEIRKHSDVPVIYLSGNSDRFNYERAKKTGFTEYLVKPITGKDLVEPFEKAFTEKQKVTSNRIDYNYPKRTKNYLNKTA